MAIARGITTAMDRALSCIGAAQGPRGQWSGQLRLDRPPHPTKPDMAPPLTALGMLALAGVPHPVAAEVHARSAAHLNATMRPGGLWRYYADIPADSDDSAICALALDGHPGAATQASQASLLALVGRDGRFPTWFQAGWDPAVDAVANAHIVAALGPQLAPGTTVAWLVDVVERAAEVSCSRYYPDPLDLHVALVRGLGRGVGALAPAVAAAASRARRRLQEREQLSAYRLAQAMVVLAASAPGDPTVAEAGEALLAAQLPDGNWPAETLFTAPNSTGPGNWHYQSWMVVTALCVRALWLARDGATGLDPAGAARTGNHSGAAPAGRAQLATTLGQ